MKASVALVIPTLLVIVVTGVIMRSRIRREATKSLRIVPARDRGPGSTNSEDFPS